MELLHSWNVRKESHYTSCCSLGADLHSHVVASRVGQRVADILLGWLLQETLGLSTWDLLAAAIDSFVGCTGTQNILNKDDTSGDGPV